MTCDIFIVDHRSLCRFAAERDGRHEDGLRQTYDLTQYLTRLLQLGFFGEIFEPCRRLRKMHRYEM